MDSADAIELHGDLRGHPATTTPGEGDHSTAGQELNRSISTSSSSDSSSEDVSRLGANENADTPLGSADFPTPHDEENGSTALKSESNKAFPNAGQGNVSIGGSDSRAIPTANSNETDLSIPDETLDNSSSSPSPSPSYPKIIARVSNDSCTVTESRDEDVEAGSKPMNERDRSLSSSSSLDSFQHGANESADFVLGSSDGSTALKPESNQTLTNTEYANVSMASSDSRAIPATTSNDADLSTVDKKLDNSESTSSTHEFECSPKVTSQIVVRETEDSPIAPESCDENISSKPMQEHDRSLSSSSSSSSSSSESSSEDPFQLDANETADRPLGFTDSPTVGKDNGAATMASKPNQTFANVEQRAIPTTTSNEADLSIPNKKSNNSLSSTTSPASECVPKGPFQDNAGGLEASRATLESRVHEQRSHEFVGSPSKPAIPGNVYSNSTTQFPPTQVMERPNDPSSSGYRIPSYVFARTKSTAPMEWSTASNESLFSIHMGSTSFNRDQLFWLGKSGELGMSGTFLDSSSNPPPPMNVKPSHGIHNSATLDNDFRAAEAKAAETMREVIRESAENMAKENAVPPAKDTHASSRISRQHDDKTKSFAFPVLSGDGDKSTSVKVGAAKQAQKSPSGTPKTALVEADTPRANRYGMAGLSRLLSYYSCFTCCRPSCL
ncbi:hypothetical protein TIFTF001_023413 [Ficus carica]|uniref:Uncharacterized protein n=1 Tax=Ficus carica TaxID=3494 RepID=A0AA88DCF3_FICCA|nr:hypothetical protein TIFTF001_023413 [Ficus carica]